MKTANIKQTVLLKADPSEVFECLMSSKKHSEFSGDVARISRKVGGGFSAYGGYCYGKNLKLLKGKKIVQSWRATDWPDKVFSTVTFSFAKSRNGTKLTFTQKGVPANQLKSIKQGWTDFYWEPMKRMFEK